MTKQQAINEATKTAKENNRPICVVKEGLHADEFAERDEDGESYGYCPPSGVSILYKWGEVVDTIIP